MSLLSPPTSSSSLILDDNGTPTPLHDNRCIDVNLEFALVVLGITLIVTIWLKRYWIVPLLEYHFRLSFARRQQIRRLGRLQDCTYDPLLVYDDKQHVASQHDTVGSLNERSQERLEDTLRHLELQSEEAYDADDDGSVDYESVRYNREEEEDYMNNCIGSSILGWTLFSVIVMHSFEFVFLVYAPSAQEGCQFALLLAWFKLVHVLDSVHLFVRKKTSTRAVAAREDTIEGVEHDDNRREPLLAIQELT